MAKGSVSRWSRIPNYLSAQEMTTGMVEFSEDKCDRCRICSKICPARSILIEKSGKGRPKKLPILETMAPDVTLCVACGCCLAACPHQAISLKRGFNAGHYFRRLSQAAEMTPPRRY
jgi:ferredoxin